MHSKVSCDRLPSYTKATRPVLKILTIAEYFPDRPRKVLACAFLQAPATLPRNLWNRRLEGPKVGLGVFEKRKNLWSKPGFDSQTVDPTVPTVILQLLIEAIRSSNWKYR
jgi:hypothetical protein